jgi:phosphoribosylformylglycinamidine cyclo-ligase
MTYTLNKGIFQLTADGDEMIPTCTYESYIDKIKSPRAVTVRHTMSESAAIAYHLEKFDAIGIDCTARCVNTIVAEGAIPCSLSAEIPDAFKDQLVPGFVTGCIQGCCSLEMSVTPLGTVRGTATGILDEENSMRGARSGDVLIGLLSSGFHDEALIRGSRILQLDDQNIKELMPEIFCKLEDELFRPSKFYTRSVMHITKTMGIKLNDMCYVGEGGLSDSLYEMLPEGVSARIMTGDFPRSGLYEMIARRGHLDRDDMFNNFNMGIGFVMAVDRRVAGDVMSVLIQIGEHPYVIGYCAEGEKDVILK